MSTLWQDVRYGLRMLARNPGFTVVVIVILAVGIGANTAVFSIINAVLLRPLPYRQPSQVVTIWKQRGKEQNSMMRRRELRGLTEQDQVFDSIAGYCLRRVYLSGIDQPQHVQAEEVSPGLFPLLGVRPALGRGFLPEEEELGNDRVVILSDSFWREHCGGTPDAIGKSFKLDDEAYTIIGVMPPDFRFPFRSSAPFWVPMVENRRPWGLPCFILARLRDGDTVDQAQGHMSVMTDRLKEAFPETTVHPLVLHRWTDDLFGHYRRMLLLSFGAAGFLLLIACSNAGNLLLVRAAGRRREIAIRMAMGSSRWRLLRQMLVESVILSLMAGSLGLLVTFGAIRGLAGFYPGDIPRMGETRVDTIVLLFGLGVSIFTGLVFGIVPAWKASDVHLIQVAKGMLLPSTGGRGWQRLHGGLIVSQICISMILLAGSGLLIRSLIAMQNTDLGFRPKEVLWAFIELPEVKYPEAHQREAFCGALLERVQRLPGVRAAALGNLGWRTGEGLASFSIEGVSPDPDRDAPEAFLNDVTPGFFDAMGIQVLAGRTLDEQDVGGREVGVVIDEKLARDYFPNTDPVGQRVSLRNGDKKGTIVGVVKTLRDFDRLTRRYGKIYIPMSYLGLVHDLVIRTDGDPMKLAGAVRAGIAAIDKDQKASVIQTADTVLSEMLAPRRFNTFLIVLSAGIALVLAAAGIYGLLQFVVAQQTHDIGIRMALGAADANVLRVTLGQGLRLALIGVAVGLAGAAALTRVLSSLLYDVTPTDPLTLALVSLVLIATALLASYLPARRATRIDPMEALRYE